MKATKIFMMAALALTFAACSNDDNDFAQQPAEQSANGEITITATIATDGATTRALSVDGDNIASNYVVGEKIAVLFEYKSAQVQRDAEVTSLSESTATVQFTIPADLTGSNIAATLVYPSTAVNAAKDGADVAAALATQTGDIATCPEVRTGSGTLNADAKTLTVASALTAQNAIFQFDTQDLTPSGIPVSEFKVSDGSGNVITTVTPSGTPFYVALPAMAAGTYWFNATYSGKPYIAKATVTTATTAGKFYTTTVKMATLGDVIKADGKFYAAGTADAVAKIAYVGSDAETSTTYNHGLALALSDVSGAQTWCTQETCTCLSTHYASESDAMTDMAGIANTDALVAYTSHTHAAANTARNYNSGTHPAGTSAWFLPSAGQWYKMRNAAGSYGTLRTNAGLESSDYWSSSVVGDKVAWYFDFKNIAWLNSYKDGNKRVRSCLAF